MTKKQVPKSNQFIEDGFKKQITFYFDDKGKLKYQITHEHTYKIINKGDVFE